MAHPRPSVKASGRKISPLLRTRWNQMMKTVAVPSIARSWKPPARLVRTSDRLSVSSGTPPGAAMTSFISDQANRLAPAESRLTAAATDSSTVRAVARPRGERRTSTGGGGPGYTGCPGYGCPG